MIAANPSFCDCQSASADDSQVPPINAKMTGAELF